MNIESEEEQDEELDDFEERTEEEQRGLVKIHESFEEGRQVVDLEASDRSGELEREDVDGIPEEEGHMTEGHICQPITFLLTRCSRFHLRRLNLH